MSLAFTLRAYSFALLSGLVLSFSPLTAEAAVLIGNTEGNNIVELDEKTGDFLGEFISPFEGFESPDTLAYGPDRNLYISSGNTPETSAIYRFDSQTGKLIDKFASGNGLFRPYGLAFGPDGLLYVSSFRSDEILRYDGVTGKFVDVFLLSETVVLKGSTALMVCYLGQMESCMSRLRAALLTKLVNSRFCFQVRC